MAVFSPEPEQFDPHSYKFPPRPAEPTMTMSTVVDFVESSLARKKGGKYAIEIRGNMASKGKYATEIGKLFGKLKTKLFNCSKLRDFYAIDEI